MQKDLSLRRRAGWPALRLDPPAGWAAALALFLVVLALRLESPTTGCPYPFLIFFPVVLVAAWLSGRAPAAAVAVASTAAAWWFLIRSPGTIGWPRPAEAGALALFLGSSIFSVALVTGLTRMAAHATEARAQAEAALASQQALAAELQHRVANNLQMVSSALTLQARSIGGTPAAAALGDATRRLDSLARLHRLLTSIGAAPDVAGVLEDLCRTQVDASGDGRVILDVAVQRGFRLDPDRLTILGMIVSEAMSNALKHGFPGGRTGRLAVRLRATTPFRAELEVRDNGAGLPDDFELPDGFNPQSGESLGLRIVQSLAQRLGGTLSLATERGTVLRVAFPIAALAGGA